MKHLKFALTLVALTAMTFGFTNCKSSAPVDKTGPEYTSAYVCPMHCKGSGSDQPGKCSVCGMDMEKNMDHEMHQGTEMDHDNHEAMDHDAHEHMYACSMHPEITGNEGDKCSICGMELTSIEGEDHAGHDHGN